MATTAIVVVGIVIVAAVSYAVCKFVGRIIESDFSIDGIFDEEAMDETRNCEAEEASINGKKIKD